MFQDTVVNLNRAKHFTQSFTLKSVKTFFFLCKNVTKIIKTKLTHFSVWVSNFVNFQTQAGFTTTYLQGPLPYQDPNHLFHRF